MAASEVIQELIRAHITGDEERFRIIARQLAAREARAGHRLVAGRIKDLLDNAPPASATPRQPTPIARPARELRSVLAASYPEERLGSIVLAQDPERTLTRLLNENRNREELAKWNLKPRRKLLFYGPPGCGKTLAAQVIAGELGMPLL